MDTSELKSDLASPLARMGVKTAEQRVPDASGIYAIFVDDARALPRFLSGRLSDGSQRPLYIGQASVSLRLRLSGWIEDHLLVSWRTFPAQQLDEAERALVAEWRPPLNTIHNPEPVAELAQLRKLCRLIAAGEG